jgi:hypothetical protein
MALDAEANEIRVFYEFDLSGYQFLQATRFHIGPERVAVQAGESRHLFR